MRKLQANFFPYSLFLIILVGCGERFIKSPVDEIIRDLPKDETFSIILHDMDVQGNFSNTYHHSYEIIRGSDPEKITSEVTSWHEVSKEEFNRHANDMGMEVVARDSTGKLTKSVAPPGYNNYVGNSRYGRWESNGGRSFWAFYGQYAFMSSLFHMATFPVRRSYYNDWRGNYYGTNRRYYGPPMVSGSYYGTGSSYNRTKNPNSAWNSKSSSFRNRVRGRTSRSGGRSSGFRSRGGGFGK